MQRNIATDEKGRWTQIKKEISPQGMEDTEQCKMPKDDWQYLRIDFRRVLVALCG
jgi:hypothetical protein